MIPVPLNGYGLPTFELSDDVAEVELYGIGDRVSMTGNYEVIAKSENSVTFSISNVQLKPSKRIREGA